MLLTLQSKFTKLEFAETLSVVKLLTEQFNAVIFVKASIPVRLLIPLLATSIAPV